MTQETEKISTKYYVVVGIIILAIILGIAFAIVYFSQQSATPFLERGCIPLTADWLGTPSTWNCPK